ncbi:unnamed protein product [Lactuca virosa]|uniref:Uncharacterized protein n=1 Tax=Lactuca virosa TaxID=75947 RepID=A0AAU9P8M7_9ASTR|nr:unnamed protein product [Lactuca virosa]
MLDLEAEVTRVGIDLDWLIKEGVVRNMEKVIELCNFHQGVGWIKHIYVSAGEESWREALHKEVVVATFDPHDARSTSSHTREMANATDSFVTCDYATLMKLGSLDINSLRQLYVDDDSGGVGPSYNTRNLEG